LLGSNGGFLLGKNPITFDNPIFMPEKSIDDEYQDHQQYEMEQ